MPPKTRGCKVSKSKALKENIDVSSRIKLKSTNKDAKSTRKALADKTNSASDDNATFLPSKPKKIPVDQVIEQENLLVKQRPRRDRRLPNRFVECNVLQRLSNSKNASIENKEESSTLTPVKKIPVVVISPLKTPITNLNSSLNAQRPKRICRLPSKFDDHSVSPTKFVPVQPAYASTPKIQTKTTRVTKSNDQTKSLSPQKTPSETLSLKKASGKMVRTKNTEIKTVSPKKIKEAKEVNKKKAKTKAMSPTKTPVFVLSTKLKRDRNVQKVMSPASKNNSADTNNNAKKVQLPRIKTKNVQNTSPNVSKDGKTTATKKLINKDFSFKILEGKKKSLKRDASNIDVYEFTYDPNDEPPPQKKKRKRPARKREPKPKSVVFKNNYDRNLAKVLSALKNTVSSQPVKHTETTGVFANPVTEITTRNLVTETTSSAKYTQPDLNTPTLNIEKSVVSEKCYNSVRVEDIAQDFEQDCCADNLNYSPVNSPCRPITPAIQSADIPNSDVPSHNNDQMNLREDLSFFDDAPVASSSMNVSVRHPAASPWRVDFDSLPIKWNVNTYVKPNMTPAFESSFININEGKKHVYTNLGPDTNEAYDLPQIFEDNTSKLKQTSIISFIKEVVEKSAKKKKDKMTPIKANSLFEDLHHTSVFNDEQVTPKKTVADKVTSDNVVASHHNVSNEISNETGSSVETSAEGDKENSTENVKNSNKNKKNRDMTFFGFDDTENQDQENVSPLKKMDKRRLRALKPRARAVLQEINDQKGPTRAAIPVAVKSNPIHSSDAANKLFDQMKSATEPPVFSDKEMLQSTGSIDITEVQVNDDSNDDVQSVHLFEDLDFVHNLKAHRKSYGKTKKAVTFRQNSISDSDAPHSEVAEQSDSSDEDDLHDLTFKVPAIEPKKPARKRKTKKQKLSKKEEKEVETWAAGFNSMCEEIEEFDLVVE